MKSGLIKFITVTISAVIIWMGIASISGCAAGTSENENKTDVDFTVVEDEDLPKELKKLIDDRKENTLRLIFTTKDYTYVVAGFGAQETSGYSIRVNGVYVADDTLYTDISLIGPAEDEPVNEVKTTPYIVLKMEKREESIVFKM